MSSRLALWTVAFATAVLTVGSAAYAQTTPLLDEVRTVSGGAAPVERSFDITQAGSYQLTLTDLKLPAALTSVTLAVTSGTTVLGTVGTTATNAAAVLDFDAPAGPVVVRIVGKPAANAGAGSVGVKVKRVSETASLQEFVASIAAPPADVPENQAILDETITASVTGTYEVVLADLGLPQPLAALEVGVTEVGGTQFPPLLAPGTMTFQGQAGVEYRILALAESPIATNAGLFSLRIREVGSGTVVLKRTVPVGRVEQIGTVVLTAAPHVLSLTDFQFPTALAEKGAALTLDGQLTALATSSGDRAFNASAGAHIVYVVAAAAASGTGSFGIEVRPAGGAALFTAVKTVGGAPGTTPAYSFVADIANAGAYRVRLADFKFPEQLTAAQLAVAQSGNLLGTLSAPGSLDINPVAGRLFLVVIAEPGSANGGVLGVDVTPAAGGAAVFEATQGVGNLFQSRKISVTAPGPFRVTLQDVGFPVQFTSLGAVVTRGAEALGKVLSGSQTGGTSPVSAKFDFDATPGSYFVNFIATPNSTENAGTYGLRVADKPPSPAITLTANPAQVTVGGTVDLTWSVTNADSCLASNGWTGSRPTAGTERTSALNTTATFKLDCTGDGGSSSATVTVNAVAQSNAGGGGAAGWLLLAGLALGLAARIASRRRPLELTPRRCVPTLRSCEGDGPA